MAALCKRMHYWNTFSPILAKTVQKNLNTNDFILFLILFISFRTRTVASGCTLKEQIRTHFLSHPQMTCRTKPCWSWSETQLLLTMRKKKPWSCRWDCKKCSGLEQHDIAFVNYQFIQIMVISKITSWLGIKTQFYYGIFFSSNIPIIV